MGLESEEPITKIQLVLASGSRFFLEGMTLILKMQKNVKIVAQASDSTEIAKYVTLFKPDFLFLDNRTLKLNFANLSSLIDGESPNTKVILFGHRDRNDRFPNIIYLTKETDALGLLEILEAVKDNNPNKVMPGEESQKNKFTRTELRVVNLVKSGLTNKEIAKRLSIGEGTVKAHLRKIFMKLNLQNRYQLIVYARKIRDKNY
ncbi:MAG TPA: response regulator transcription factor [Thermodesulfobacteriota bacterium]|nr:response regulator transcription factor [Thermodesulfobacteriota bacterium]